MSTASASDINAGRAVIGVELDDSRLSQQMQAVSARMNAAAAGLSATTLPSLVTDVTGPARDYESTLKVVESVHKSGAVSANYYRQQLAEIAVQYTESSTPAQRLGVALSKLSGDMQRGDLSADQYAAKLESLMADFLATSTATDRFEGSLVALDHDLRRGAITQDRYKVALEAAHREFRAAANPLERYQDEIRILDVRLKDGNISQQRYNLAVDAARREFLAASTPAQRYQEEIRQLDTQLKQGVITQRQYEDAMRRAKLAMVESHLAANESGSAFSGLRSEIAGYVAGFASIATVTTVIRGVAEEFKKIEDEALLAEKLGMANERFQGLKIAAQQADVEMETFTSAMQRMAVAIGKISLRGEESTKWLDRMGLSLDDLFGLSADEQFLIIAAAMRENLTESERLAAATEIFGRNTTDMVRLLELTRSKLDETTAAAIENGQALGKDQVEAIKRANDAMDDLGNAWEGLKRALAVSVVPALTFAFKELADILQNVANSWRDFKKEFTPQAGSVVGDIVGAEPDVEYDNTGLERWRREHSKEAIRARTDEYASQFESEMEAASNEYDRQRDLVEYQNRLAQERAAAEQQVIDQTNEYASQFGAAMNARSESMDRLVTAEREAADAAAASGDDAAAMFAASMEGRSEAMDRLLEDERLKLESRTSRGAFSGWALGRQFTSETVDKEQLAELKKLNDGIRKIKIETGSPVDFYT
jgi:hypothetical protein